MRKHIVLLLLLASAFTLGWSLRPTDPGAPRATGIGGVFFTCSDPAKLRAWYAEHLGMKVDEYGGLFEFRNMDDPSVRGYLQWSPFAERTKYFQPGNKDFMVNYRVTGLRGIMQKMRASGVVVKDSAAYEYGTFVHVLDPDSTLIELWEPIDSVFTRLYDGKTNH